MRIDALRGPDAGTLLIRAIRSHATAAGLAIDIGSIACRPWASATFTGTRHRLTVTADAVPGLRHWIDGLPDAEFAMRGHIVADLVVDGVETVADRQHVTIAALTLIDG